MVVEAYSRLIRSRPRSMAQLALRLLIGPKPLASTGVAIYLHPPQIGAPHIFVSPSVHTGGLTCVFSPYTVGCGSPGAGRRPVLSGMPGRCHVPRVQDNG